MPAFLSCAWTTGPTFDRKSWPRISHLAGLPCGSTQMPSPPFFQPLPVRIARPALSKSIVSLGQAGL